MKISDRQKRLMVAIIQEFMKSAEAVGSQDLKETYNFEFSPATIRNDLADLVKEGFLYKEHSSSGRTPTTLAWRYYIDMLDEESDTTIDEIEIREKIFSNRFNLENIMREAITFLQEISHLTCFGIIKSNIAEHESSQIYFSGLARLLDQKEFQNIEVLKNILIVLENPKHLIDILNRSKSSDISILIGDEIDLESFKSSTIIYQKLDISNNCKLYIGTLSSTRVNYSKLIPVIRRISSTIKDATIGLK